MHQKKRRKISEINVTENDRMNKPIKVSNSEYYDKMLFIDDALSGMDAARKMITDSFEALKADNSSDFTDELIKIYNESFFELTENTYKEAETLKNDIFDAVDDFVKADDDIGMKLRHINNAAVKYINITEGEV